jgi:rubrerythrin
MLARLNLPDFSGKPRLEDLGEREILALAVSCEEEDARIYATYAATLRASSPASAAVFDGMAAEEDGHRRRLIALYVRRFGEVIVPVRRDEMERQSQDFYAAAAARATDAETRLLLGDLAAAEAGHRARAHALEEEHLGDGVMEQEDRAAHRQFILTWVQPGLAGLMDGSVSTLAPIFAVAFATHDPWTTFLVGLSASVGAGISMGFTEAAHDDGRISGRGAPWKRGLASGVMTTLGGLGHALPYLIPAFWTATMVAFAVVFLELWAIVWIQNRYMETPFLRATFQVVLGGSLVLAAGILIGGV